MPHLRGIMNCVAHDEIGFRVEPSMAMLVLLKMLILIQQMGYSLLLAIYSFRKLVQQVSETCSIWCPRRLRLHSTNLRLCPIKPIQFDSSFSWYI